MWQSEPVQAWVVVMIVVVVIAAALTVYGALSDRAKNRRRAAEMLGPPKRDIPHLPADARPPRYVTEAQARRPPQGVERRVDRPREPDQRSIEINIGYASADFVTAGSRAVVLDDALVLVCDDDVETIRELLPALEQALKTQRPLVVVAPAIAQDVLGTLEVNAIQGKVPGVAVLADDAVRAQAAEASGAVPVDATDRRSGWLDPQALGHAARWTSTRTTSRIAPAVRTGAAR
ncbi:MAG: hypothetical protein ACRYG2_31615 [Janthinobacterium lividum]